MIRLASICLGFGALLLSAGCGPPDKGPKTVTALGVVTLDGEPVEGAAVVFIDDGGQYPARGTTDASGRFSLDAFEYKTGAVPGSYKAIVQRTVVSDQPPPKGDSEEAEHAGEVEGAFQSVYNDLPKKYAMPNDELVFTIPETGVEDLKLELVSK